ncbi:DNA repair and recombination protein RAD5C [Pyrenophora tritici-repentis]|nr:DNA repair and recombination protein RAD5C [Pyrenophora tritici-repentis]
MLAVIVNSLGRALDYAVTHTRGSTTSWQDITPSKTTLVVVPSSLLLDSWEEEIRKHLLPETVVVHRYHGSDKAIDLSDLLRKDIVLTTYATIATDFCRGQAILSHVAWYRLVLDEGNYISPSSLLRYMLIFVAHYIRNPSRKQYRAIQSIPAHIRWCLTGTPIQNSLEDLGALVKFLRVPVLEDLVVFRRSISTPILTNTNGRFANMSTLLQAICLRRTKALLNQPEPITMTTLLQLSPKEHIQYHDYAEGCRHAIDLAVSGHSIQKANQHVIQAILGMRLFCNDGEKALINRKHARGLPIEPEEALSFLQTSSDAKCINCDCDIVAMYQRDDQSSGTLIVCQHLLCGVCLVEFETDLDENLEDGRSRCPICGLRADIHSFLVNPSSAENDSDKIKVTEYPTKLLSLLDNVRNQSIRDKWQVSFSTNCIIFSFWKTTLDITASLFDKYSISCFRIHGTLSASKRSRILTDFEESSTTRVLLITLGTGAVGSNKLKAANIIHIVEPQWNPSVENQAIGRVIRLGQERAVTIIRYIMKDTIEEAVQSRQLRKLQLARGGFGLSKEVQGSDRVSAIMSLMCPSILNDKSGANAAPPSST